MANYASIQERIDYGKGRAAEHIGYPYAAFRLGPRSTGDYPSAWTKVADGFNVYERRLKSERSVDVGIANAALFYDVVANMSPFLLGDVFANQDGPYMPGIAYGEGAISVAGFQFNAFGLAWHPAMGKAVGGRLDRRARIYRPAVTPDRLKTDNSDYWRSTHDGDQPLVLVDGQYALGARGAVASFVPIGITSAYRPYGQKPFEITGSPPGMVRPTHWFAYLPPLPGYSAREGDALITEDGARYVVVQPYYQTAGVVGSQLMLDRTSAEKT